MSSKGVEYLSYFTTVSAVIDWTRCPKIAKLGDWLALVVAVVVSAAPRHFRSELWFRSQWHLLRSADRERGREITCGRWILKLLISMGYSANMGSSIKHHRACLIHGKLKGNVAANQIEHTYRLCSNVWAESDSITWLELATRKWIIV